MAKQTRSARSRKGKGAPLSGAAKDEIRVGVKRLLRRLARTNVAKSRLESREKQLRAECKSRLELLGEQAVEVPATASGAPGAKGQLVETESVQTKDPANLALCRERLKKAEFEACCPRSVDTRKLGKADEELLGELVTRKKTSFRFDLVQAQAASEAKAKSA